MPTKPNIIEEQIKGKCCKICQDFTTFEEKTWCTYWNEKTLPTQICIQFVEKENPSIDQK